MKRNKFVLLLMAVMAVFFLSSCLDGENNSTAVYSGYVRVSGLPGNYKFVTPDGVTINLLNQNALDNTFELQNYALMGCTYEVGQLTGQTSKIDATLLGLQPIRSAYAQVVQEDGVKPVSNAPVILVGGPGYPIQFAWDAMTMFVPINYLIKGAASKLEKDNELKAHSFELYYDVNEKTNSKGELILHLRHTVENDVENENRIYNNMSIVHFDMQRVLMEYARVNGGETPVSLVIEYEHSNRGIFDDKVTSEETVIDYRRVVEGFKK